jgi:hypothetical protein
LDHLPIPAFRRGGGLVGCVSGLTLGKLLEIDLTKDAESGRNIEDCSKTFK